MRSKQYVSSLLTIVLAGSAVMAQEGDVGIRISGGRLETVLASGEPPAQTFGAEVERVFAAELEFNLTTNTVVTDEPGLASNEALLASQSLGFNLRKALRRWNGTEFAAASSTMSAGGGDLGLDFISTPATDVLTAGHTIIVPAAPFDFHYDWRLDGATASSGIGVYLVELELTNPMGSFMTSDPFWLVFNYGEDEAVHDAAVDWAAANLVPTPGAGGLAAGVIVLMARRRRS